MSLFTEKHWIEIADTIGEWVYLHQPEINEKHVDSLINGFIIVFMADSHFFNRRLFEYGIARKMRDKSIEEKQTLKNETQP